MAGLTSQERLQPSLLDRLTDADPRTSREPVDARVLNRQQLRAAVLRDLSWLFNTTRAEPTDREHVDPEAARWRGAPHARRSVLNFGLPALAGESVGTLDFSEIEAAVRQAVIDFEPRIDPQSLAVELSADGAMQAHHNALKLMIRAKMWNQPVPLELLLSAQVDVETGNVAVRDLR
ncbi:MAG TPA: type VI secretion system baseplate subunit TssE [Burkholderiaceae bacterium]